MPLLLLLLAIVFFPSLTSPATTTISIPLHHQQFKHYQTPNPSPSPSSLSSLAISSLLRAHHLKNPKPKTIKTPLSPHSYGGYSITLSFGTPPQRLPFLLDTGSQLTWLPCTPSYLCRDCPSPKHPFIPKLSSSSKLIGCLNPKCSWIHSHLSCPNCPSSSSTNCSNPCPPYLLTYGSGSTAGLLLSETLSFSSSDVPFPNFAVGCSLVSISQPSGGVAGFGRGPVSLPSQLNLSRFSYCLISRRFDDDNSVTGALLLDPPSQDSSSNISFAPFLKNPTVNDVFSIYYYVALNRITVGGKKVKIPKRFFEPGPDGNGGAIVDSGTTFTYVEPSAFKPLSEAFVEQVKYERSPAAEAETGLSPCFALPEGNGEVSLPELAFHFKGGAEMRLPFENYFVIAGSEKAPAVCLAMISEAGDGGGGDGPSMILGSFQQQNYYVVYDLEREKLGFRQQRSCIG